MLRLCLTFLFFFSVAVPLAAQDIFPCRDQQGRLFITDNPTTLPVGCRLLGSPPAGGSLSVVAPPDIPSPATRGAMAALSRQEQRRLNQEHLWRGRADDLLQDYRSGISGVYRAGRSQNRRDARQFLELIREKKRVLLAEVRKDGRRAVWQELVDQLKVVDE